MAELVEAQADDPPRDDEDEDRETAFSDPMPKRGAGPGKDEQNQQES